MSTEVLKTIHGDMRQGARVWIPALKDDQNGDIYVPGTLAQVPSGSKVLVQKEGGGDPVEVKIDSIMPSNPPGGAAEDICLLLRLNEASVLSNVLERFETGSVYTWIGTILISMNPFEHQPDRYDSTAQLRFSTTPPRGAPPHLYAVAEAAFRGVVRMHSRSQSICVSGESGAGKTYANRLLLSYLSFRSGGGAAGAALSRAMADSNPVLEAFGNAKTTRNDNSSRFGKFQKVQLETPVGKILTVHISTYLLESARVTSISSNLERNYHIFYMLIMGVPAQQRLASKAAAGDTHANTNIEVKRAMELSKLDVPIDIGECAYLNQSTTRTIEERDDGKEFIELLHALDAVGLKGEMQLDILRTATAILHTGNIVFSESSDEGASEGATASLVDAGPLKTAAKLLRVDEGRLGAALLSRSVKAGDTQVIKKRSRLEAERTRDALAKGVYVRLFDTLVRMINAELDKVGRTAEDAAHDVGATGQRFIGLLDLFGFEAFDHNSFEQVHGVALDRPTTCVGSKQPGATRRGRTCLRIIVTHAIACSSRHIKARANPHRVSGSCGRLSCCSPSCHPPTAPLEVSRCCSPSCHPPTAPLEVSCCSPSCHPPTAPLEVSSCCRPCSHPPTAPLEVSSCFTPCCHPPTAPLEVSSCCCSPSCHPPTAPWKCLCQRRAAAPFTCLFHRTAAQLCINFANEKLQAFFVQQVFANEEYAHKSEGVFWPKLHLPDNTAAIDIISKPSSGVVFLLSSLLQSATEADFFDAVYTTHRKSRAYKVPAKLLPTEGFVLRHYAGDVIYTSSKEEKAATWLDKNSYALAPEVEEVLHSSTLYSYFSKPDLAPSKAAQKKAAKGGAAKGGAAVSRTVAKDFLRSVEELLQARRLHAACARACAHECARTGCSSLHTACCTLQLYAPPATCHAAHAHLSPRTAHCTPPASRHLPLAHLSTHYSLLTTHHNTHQLPTHQLTTRSRAHHLLTNPLLTTHHSTAHHSSLNQPLVTPLTIHHPLHATHQRTITPLITLRAACFRWLPAAHYALPGLSRLSPRRKFTSCVASSPTGSRSRCCTSRS